MHSLRCDEPEKVEWETDEPANEEYSKKHEGYRRAQREARGQKWNELHALLAERGELHLWPLTLKRKASGACDLVMNIGIHRLDYIIDLIRTSKEKIDETDERVQNALEHTAVWVDSQEANCMQAVVDINDQYGPTVFEVQQGPKYSQELSNKFLEALKKRVAIFGIPETKYAHLANPQNPVPTSNQLGSRERHVVKTGSGYDLSNNTGKTVACKAANHEIGVGYNLQQLNSRVGSFGFGPDGSQGDHGDVDNLRAITAYSKHKAKLVFTWGHQEA